MINENDISFSETHNSAPFVAKTDAALALTTKMTEKPTGLQAFIKALQDAHQYVHARRGSGHVN